jgi:hypothetical protein
MTDSTAAAAITDIGYLVSGLGRVVSTASKDHYGPQFTRDEDRWLRLDRERLLRRYHGPVAPRLVSIVEDEVHSEQLQRAPPPARRPDQRPHHR